MKKNWMKIETETSYGEPVVILYNSDVYKTDEDLHKNVELASMRMDSAIGGAEECDLIVMNKDTADFWFSIIKELKQEAFIEGQQSILEAQNK